ncbi:MAG: YdcF family protein [Spirochaetes bacterium]|nr:MAG: YdcF family protein [Spirochaetota bacterium]
MFLLSKILQILVLPPGIIIVALILAFLFLFKKKYLVTKFLLFFSLISLYSLSLEPISDLIIKPLEDLHPPLDRENFSLYLEDRIQPEYIVVLGGGTVESSPEEGGSGTLNTTSLKRLIYGYLLFKETKLPIILAGGRVIEKEIYEPEAEVALRTLLEMGVPENKIGIEAESRNTWENAEHVKERFSPEKIILVTSAYHMPRSVYSFRQNGMDCIPAPTDYKTNRAVYNFLSFFPDMEELKDSYSAIREFFGLLYYRIRYQGSFTAISFPKSLPRALKAAEIVLNRLLPLVLFNLFPE